jgi:hypothetical protein
MLQTSTSLPKEPRINIHRAEDLNFWTQKLKVSVINLKIAVSETDGLASHVENWLRNRKYIE